MIKKCAWCEKALTDMRRGRKYHGSQGDKSSCAYKVLASQQKANLKKYKERRGSKKQSHINDPACSSGYF